ncbi:MAG: arginine--tRNA ligase [Pseudomonadota bacterium]
MISVTQNLSNIVSSAFEALELPKELGQVRVSDRPDLAQFQCNGAMAAAKQAKKNPREIAQAIVDVLSKNEIFSQVDIAGPGFINLNVTDSFLQETLQTMASDDRFGCPIIGDGQVILDYGGMNVAKAMHVGHLRPNVIGDCLRRLLLFAGYEALGDIHMGDWGLQMGQIISEFQLRHPDWVYFDAAFEGPYPEEAPFDYKELEEIYPQASQACKEDKARLEIARKATAELQEGRPGYKALWQHFMALSIADIKDNLAPLEIDFDIWKGEADVNDLIPKIAKDLEERDITYVSDGATIINVERNSDKKEMPPLIFFKSDGAVTYGTTDIGTIYDRIKLYPDLKKMIYVVDKRQSLHFEQVFRASDKAGYTEDIEMLHIGNGTVNGPDGKPFKTREGKAMTFRDMVSTVIDKAHTRLDEADLAKDIDESERQDIARRVGVAALKFAELSNQTHIDYAFDIDKMTSFEGKTGPYLLYQAVRIQSLLRKAEFTNQSANLTINEADRDLALMLTQFPEVIQTTVHALTPHSLCEYLFKLAQSFSSFYGNCHILSEKDELLRNSRLNLSYVTLKQLEKGLELLGISIPERM